jgi:hypothetical protein
LTINTEVRFYSHHSFRGPAPLHHTLLTGETHAGVTLQTLHPEKFDHGAILAQTPQPGFEIPNASKCTYQELLDFITPKAAQMLVQGIRDRLFIPDSDQCVSSQGTNLSSTAKPDHPLRHAPKITADDRQINWNTMTAEEILRRDRVLGRLWNVCHPVGKPKTRLVFRGLTNFKDIDPDFSWEAAVLNLIGKESSLTPSYMKKSSDVEDFSEAFLLPLWSHGERYRVPSLRFGDAIVLRSPDNGAVLINEITMDGRRKTSAKAILDWAQYDIAEHSMWTIKGLTTYLERINEPFRRPSQESSH